jgi:imidazole glycerol-phosphate synthase subunit HisH
MIGIIDIDLGNLRSVSNAIDASGFDRQVVRSPAELDSTSHIILPGVGSFHTAMANMRRAGLAEPVRKFAASGRPFLGICLGMQLLADWGEEGGLTQGLGLVPGRVQRFAAERVKSIPHVGWNGVEQHVTHPVFAGVKSGVDFYFVHSYHLAPTDPTTLLATTDCGEVFASIVGRANVLGFQFHPERSQNNGLRLIENFCAWDGRW